MNENSVLVTGANGFLGRKIISELIGEGKTVYATDMGSASAVPNIAYQKADITRPEELNDAFGSSSTVIHAAGLAHVFTLDSRSDEKFRQINEIGTGNVAMTAAQAGAGHLILISSVSVYGPNTLGIYDENRACLPVGAYALSKYHAELRAIEIANKSGMALTILRLSTLYGEGDPGNIRRLICSLDQGRFFWVGDGSNRKSLLYNGDAARACAAVASRPASGIWIYNVSAPACSMSEIVEGITDALGKEKQPLPLRIPGRLALFFNGVLSRMPNQRFAGMQQTIKKWLSDDVYDTARFERYYGFRPQIGVKEGMRREVEWYRNYIKS